MDGVARLELVMENTKEGLDPLEQSIEKGMEYLRGQIQDLQGGMEGSPVPVVLHEEFMAFQDNVLSMLASLEAKVDACDEEVRQELAIFKTTLMAQVMATHEAPRVEVLKP